MKPNEGTFRAGLIPWNKGTTGLMRPNTGSFTAGHRRNEKSDIGGIKIRTDKQGKPRAWIKVAQPNTWRPRAQIEWERECGPIPAGCLVHHKNRDTLDDAIGNLALMTRAEHLAEHRQEHHRVYARGDAHPSRLHPERVVRGERNGNAMLTEESVRAIRSAVTTKSRHELAALHGVKPATIKAVVTRRSWRHVN